MLGKVGPFVIDRINRSVWVERTADWVADHSLRGRRNGIGAVAREPPQQCDGTPTPIEFPGEMQSTTTRRILTALGWRF